MLSFLSLEALCLAVAINRLFYWTNDLNANGKKISNFSVSLFISYPVVVAKIILKVYSTNIRCYLLKSPVNLNYEYGYGIIKNITLIFSNLW